MFIDSGLTVALDELLPGKKTKTQKEHLRQCATNIRMKLKPTGSV